MIAPAPQARPFDRESLIADYRYLCARAARKFLRSSSDRNDLEQVAAIGLIKAADRYDVAQGAPFEAYAWVLILGELMHYVRDSERPMRVPRRLRELERRWSLAERDLWMELNREPSENEVAHRLNLSKRARDEFSRYRQCGSVLSMDGLRPNEQRALSYTIDEQLDRLGLESELAQLTQNERDVLVEIYERDTPVVEIAERLGYSRRHVTRLHRSALAKLAPLAANHS